MNTLKKSAVIEFEEKKSKFIGYAFPINSKQEAEQFINKIKIMHPTATHNCYAYKVIDNGQEYFKVDDNGEPSGTAGKPMGDIINYMGVDNMVVVATRYFGGIKLGAGGLVRNYAKTAKLAIQEAGITPYIKKDFYLLEFSYDKNHEIDAIIDQNDIIDKGYNEKITYKVNITEEILKKIENIKDVMIVKL